MQHSFYAEIAGSDGEIRTGMKCTSCDLCSNPKLQTNCMSGTGNPGATFMFVGFAPAEEDDRIGYPMTGRNGKLFYSLLNRAGYDTSSVYVTNTIKCSTFGADPKKRQWDACSEHLKDELRRIKPKCVVAVGAKALEFLTGQTGVRRLLRTSIPCLLDENIFVYAINQPAAIFHTATPEDGRALERSIIEELRWILLHENATARHKSQEREVDYKLAGSVKDVMDFIDEMEPHDELCADLETEGLFPGPDRKIVALGLSNGPRMGRAIPLFAPGITTLLYWSESDLHEKIIPRVVDLLKRKKLFGHNFVQFDQKWLRHAFGIWRCNVQYDTMYAYYLHSEEPPHNLEAAATSLTDMTSWKETFELRDMESLRDYLCKDVDAPWRIREALKPKLSSKQLWLLRELLIPLGQELMEIEYRGVLVDKDAIKKSGDTLSLLANEEIMKLHLEPPVGAFVAKEGPINLQSPHDIRKLLFDYMKLKPIKRTKSGADWSADSDTLETYKDSPVVEAILRHRKICKLKSTYCDGLEKQIEWDGRVHTSYSLTGTVTGRPNSREPNLLNIPKEKTSKGLLNKNMSIKSSFVAEPGRVMLQADYSQAELRTIASRSNDEAMIDIFVRGLDAHRATAAKAYGIALEEVTPEQRDGAKEINFGIIYGKHEETLIEDFIRRGNTVDQAKEFYGMHKRTFHGIWSYLADQERMARQYGYVETAHGRRRRISEITNRSIRQIDNFETQSLASDVTEFALVRCAMAMRKLNLDAHVVLTVYDSINFSVNQNCFWKVVEVVNHIMSTIHFDWMRVPFLPEFEAGFNWGNMTKVDPVNKKFISA